MTSYTWIGSNGAWEYAPNWSPAGTPGQTDSAFITASGTYTVTTTQELIQDLTTASNATLSIGGYLVVGGTLENAGTIELANPVTLNASLTAHGAFTNSGTLEVLEGNAEMLGAFDNLGTIDLGPDGSILFRHGLSTAQLGSLQGDGGFLDFYGTLDNTGAIFDAPDGVGVAGFIDGGTIAGTLVVANLGALDDYLALSNNPVFTGAGGIGRGAIDATADGADLGLGDLDSASPETIANVTINVGRAGNHNGSAVGGDVVFAASTTINMTGISSLEGSPVNDGTINAVGAGSTIYFGSSDSPSFTNERSLLIGSGVVAFIEALGFVNTGDIRVDGTLTLASGSNFTGMPNPLATESNIGGTIEGAGEFAISQVSASIVQGAALSVANWSLSGSGTLVTMSESLSYAGHFSLGAGAALSLTGGNLTLTGTADLAGGRIDGPRLLVTEGTTDVSGFTIGPTSVWVNTGAVTQSGDDVMISDASGAPAILYNAPTGTYAIADDSGIGIGVSPDSYFNNGGLLEKTGGSGTSIVAANIYNTGEIDVLGGALDLLEQLWGPGAVDVGAGATLEFGGAPGGSATSTVYSNGDLTFAAGSTLTLAGVNLGVTGSVDFAGATLDGDDRLFTYCATRVSGLAIGDNSVWVNQATATQSGGDVELGGAAILFNASLGIYDIADASGIGVGASASSYINNAGTFEKTGGGGTSVIAANMYNSGEIAVSSGALDFQGALWGPGQAEVGAGATLEVDGVVGGRAVLAFSVSGGEISLDDLAVAGENLFHGAISGFGAGDSINIGAPFGTGTTPHFAEFAAGTGGVLTLTDGSTSASIVLLGVYDTGNFATHTDPRGGTLLTYHA